MLDEHKLAPFNEQDKLDEFLLRTNTGVYLSISNSSFQINGTTRYASNIEEQDKLDEGLIKINNNSYYPINSIEEVTEGCFVATAVYENINAPEVSALRNFRDGVLRQSWAGRFLIEFYYSGAGKKTGNFLKRHPSVISLVKSGLDRVAKRYSLE